MENKMETWVVERIYGNMQRMLHSSLIDWARRQKHHTAAKCSQALSLLFSRARLLSPWLSTTTGSTKGAPLCSCLKGIQCRESLRVNAQAAPPPKRVSDDWLSQGSPWRNSSMASMALFPCFFAFLAEVNDGS